MSAYSKYNDYYLLDLIAENNEDALEILYKKYKIVIEIKARQNIKNKFSGIDLNDLIQEGMIGLNEAIRSFKLNKEVKFTTFATLCIDRKMKTYLIKQNRNKHKLLNESLSLDYVATDSDEPLVSFIAENSNYTPENIVVNIEMRQELYDKIKRILTPFELEVLDLKINGFNYREISNVLSKEIKAIDNALQRIKNKIKKADNI